MACEAENIGHQADDAEPHEMDNFQDIAGVTLAISEEFRVFGICEDGVDGLPGQRQRASDVGIGSADQPGLQSLNGFSCQ